MMLEEVTDTAKELIRFKSETDTIPFARETGQYFGIGTDEELLREFGFWASVVHFEMRYRSLEYFLERSVTDYVLELSSGFSFRGMEFCWNKPERQYIDTDLPAIIERKKKMLDDWDLIVPSNLTMSELDVTDISAYPKVNGSITVLNEGLLLYFNREVQKRILGNIRNLLIRNGGTWVTADIYLTHETNSVGSDGNRKWDTFFKKKEVHQHLFESFDQAAQFFFDNGFELIEKYEPEFEKLSGVSKLFKYGTPAQLESLRSRGKIQETWHLKPI